MVLIRQHLYCNDNLFDIENHKVLTAVNLALHAEVLLEKDVDYIVRDGRVEIVDQFTGRIADKRRWPHGIHKAVELKEDLKVNKEGTIFNTITIQLGLLFHHQTP